MKQGKASTTKHTAVGDGIRTAGSRIHEFSETIAEKGDHLVHQGQDAAGQIQDSVEKGYQNVVNYVKTHPVQSALIAGGVGLLLGRLLKR